ncbi:unnamed protein product [Heterosigma akashiwo]
MQMIDPVVSLPYWEYTVDTDLYGYNIWESPIFSEEWFSPFLSNTQNHIVDQGRFAYLEVPKVSDGFDVFNPYGLLRTPWVTDPTPYLTRGKFVNGATMAISGVECSDFVTAFNASDLATLNMEMNGFTHGPVHIQIGGEWNLEEEMLDFMDDYGDFRADLALIFKVLWRTGFARCPTTCTEGETCQCTAPLEVLEQAGLTAYEALMQADVLKYLDTDGTNLYQADSGRYHIRGKEGSPEEEQFFLKMLQALSNPGYVGEMYTSSAPTDPTFWILHPTIERLLSARRLIKDTRPFNETWGYTHEDYIPTDNGWVCDWSSVEGWGLPTCVQGTCSGHHANDVLEFKFANFPGREFTNQELYNFIEPTNIDLPYMYDSYNWDHCGFGVDY